MVICKKKKKKKKPVVYLIRDLILDFFCQATYLSEMSAGLTEETSDEEEDKSLEGESETFSVNPPVRREDKKTITQRNKEKEKKAKELKARQLKEEKQKKHEMFRFLIFRIPQL